MATISNSTTINGTARQFIDLSTVQAAGEATMFVDDVEGILLGIEVRGGTYTVNDRKTGQPIVRPNSWIAHWQTPTGEKLMSWPTYVDQATGQVRPWSRFDKRINLAQCSQQRVTLHMWKDDRSFYHLEVVEAEVNINPLPIMGAGAPAPWPMQ